MQSQIIKFLKTLSSRDRLFYLLMRSYEHELTMLPNDPDIISEISQIYESELKHIICYEFGFASICDNAEPSIDGKVTKLSDNQIESLFSKDTNTTPNVPPIYNSLCDNSKIKDEFAESLGPWASSFSSDDEN